jgi:hypothetical protein
MDPHQQQGWSGTPEPGPAAGPQQWGPPTPRLDWTPPPAPAQPQPQWEQQQWAPQPQWAPQQEQWPQPEQQWTQQQWAQPPQQWGPAQPPTPSGGNRGVLIAVLVAIAVVLAGGGVAWFVWQHADSTSTGSTSADASSTGSADPSAPGSGAPAVESSAARPTGSGHSIPGGASPQTSVPSSSSAAGVDPEQQALDQLGSLRAQSLPRVVLDNRWVAQVASKSVGIIDPLQTAQNGTHTFFARDILAESLAARGTVGDPSRVYVLWATDFGKRSTAADGSPYWVTLVDAGFTSADDVQTWCAQTYPTLSPQQLADTCAARQLNAPHD